MSKKRAHEQKKQAEIINFELPFEPDKKFKTIIYASISVIAFALAYYYLAVAKSVNGYFSFPLDDPWIHLTFAKNLAQYFSFSYFKNEMATAGSTSPVYTFLVAAGFVVSNNEMIISYVIGILFFILSGVYFYKLSGFDFAKENYFALLFTAIFVADKWMSFISVSGMETTMFIFTLIAAAYFYRKRNTAVFAVFLGLILWGRPDGVTFIGALAVDYFFAVRFSKTDKTIKLFSKNDFVKIGIIAGAIVVLYFIMNFVLSGSLLPNTYSAKLTYYSPEMKSRSEFLKLEVWDYFTSGAYGILAVGFIFSAVKMLYDLAKKKYNPNILYVLAVFALIFVYWFKLPYSHRFGRYLMPAIPFIILASGLGFREMSIIAGKYFKSKNLANGFMILVSAVIILYSFLNYNENKTTYAGQCAYIHDRQVVTAMWIKENTKPEDIIATHDVGAIGYYSDRKIVDVAGLITPELITKINDKNYSTFLMEFLKNNNVSYLAFLREWYRVVNQNPLYTSINKEPIEFMDVFKYQPGKTYIINGEANSIIMAAQDMLGRRSPQQALQYLQQALRVEPNSSYTYLMLAYAYSGMRDNANAEKSLKKALEIFPDFKEALLLSANFDKQTGKRDEAVKSLERLIKIDPQNKAALDMLKSVSDTTQTKK
ncbi:MAG TPA: tetratricopeptide repeat protein [Ignavibacteria bacterium]|nr:tetratricopeptide repeat protein [Ignavibacteria bacterium]